MEDDNAPVTPDEVVELNRGALVRVATFARAGSFLVLVLSAVVAFASVWRVVRDQQHLGPFAFSLNGQAPESGPSLLNRLDALCADLFTLFEPALLLGIGLILRLASDHVLDRLGESITEIRFGDVLPRMRSTDDADVAEDEQGD